MKATPYTSKTNTVNVTNTVVVPKVVVSSRSTTGLSFADYVKVLKTDVDMNNNTNDYVSIFEDTTSGNAKNNAEGNKVTVKNVIVKDDRVNDNEVWEFYIPINSTFTIR